MILYNLKTDKSKYRITKFNDELEPESVYLVDHEVCECPAGVRDTCRHRKMLPAMIERVDTAWFYCFDTQEWFDPTGDAGRFKDIFGGPALNQDCLLLLCKTQSLCILNGCAKGGAQAPADEAHSPSEPAIRRLR